MILPKIDDIQQAETLAQVIPVRRGVEMAHALYASQIPWYKHLANTIGVSIMVISMIFD